VLVAAIIGFCFGFFGSIPIAGPIAALVLQRGLVGRFRAGALIGAGAAFAEAGYAFMAFWGFSTFLEVPPS
jgi:threonine/homoserine/homoserine lactone efflux protein